MTPYYIHRFILSALQILFVVFVRSLSSLSSVFINLLIQAYSTVITKIKTTLSHSAAERLRLFQNQVLVVSIAFALCWLPRNVMLFLMFAFPSVMHNYGFLLVLRAIVVLCHAHPAITAITYVVSGL